MPHLIIECTNKISSELDFSKIFSNIHNYLVNTLPTDISTCKSRVLEYDKYFVGDNKNNQFLNVTLKILKGRSQELKHEVGSFIKNYFDDEIISLDLDISVSVSVEIIELSFNYFK